jgi:hypothetical protein
MNGSPGLADTPAHGGPDEMHGQRTPATGTANAAAARQT